MDKNTAILIEQVGNGFLVRPETPPHQMTAMSEVHVFQTVAELVQFVLTHFEHRCATVAVDDISGNDIAGVTKAMLR